MEDVISVSSDESDVEIVGCYTTRLTKAEPLPAVRGDVTSVDVTGPPCHTDPTDTRWNFPQLKLHKRLNCSCEGVKDLTGTDADRTIDKLLADVSKSDNISTREDISDKAVFTSQKLCTRDSSYLASRLGSVPKQQHLDFQEKQLKQKSEALICQKALTVKLERLPLLETYTTGLRVSLADFVNEDCATMTMCYTDICKNSKRQESTTDLRTATASNILAMKMSIKDEYPVTVVASQAELKQGNNRQLQNQETMQPASSAESIRLDKSVRTSNDESSNDNERDAFFTSRMSPSLVYAPFSQDDQENELHCSKMEQLETDEAEPDRRHHSGQSPPLPFPVGCNFPRPINCNTLSHTSPGYHNVNNEDGPLLTSELTENSTEWQSDLEEYQQALDHDSPVSLLWQDGSEEEDMSEQSDFGLDFRAVSEQQRHSVCSVSLAKLKARSTPVLFDKDDEGFGTPKMLCRRSLSLVYSTIDENYSEGTLELLCDLLQPGYYPPKDITSHLLRGILLNPQCRRHLCVQAFALLMRTQSHHMADITTIPWDWDLLTSVMASQDHTTGHRREVVRMLLEYIVQTLEDDFHAKRSTFTLDRSIAKATLSCDQQFPRVRDVIRWLFNTITKSTECVENNKTSRENDEHVRMVSILQRMLSLALEVDCCPALSSAKLSQELFHMLISDVPLRAHRMLLLETLQSKLLRYKLLEHLLVYACPLKTHLPMSLSLLLHFLKNCTLQPDPLDHTEGWQKWEELVHLLWMLLLSYNKAMKKYLYSSVKNQRGEGGRSMTYKTHDIVSKVAVREAVEAFLLRSQADLGKALPLHVEESLSYLQDHLLDVCQC